MTSRDYWKRQRAAQTKQRQIEQWQEYARILEQEAKEMGGTLEEHYQLLDHLADVVVDVDSGRQANIQPLVDWYKRRRAQWPGSDA